MEYRRIYIEAKNSSKVWELIQNYVTVQVHLPESPALLTVSWTSVDIYIEKFTKSIERMVIIDAFNVSSELP